MQPARRVLLVCLLTAIYALPAQGAISYDNASSASSSVDAATLSWSHTIGAESNRILIVGVAAEDTSQTYLVISSVKYNGVNMSFVSGSSVSLTSSTTRKTELYYLLDSGLPAAGTYTVVVTYSGNIANRNAGAISLSGAAQHAREAVEVHSQSDSGTITTDIITLTNGAWVVDVLGSGSSGTFTATSSGMTERWDVSADSSSGAGEHEERRDSRDGDDELGAVRRVSLRSFGGCVCSGGRTDISDGRFES